MTPKNNRTNRTDESADDSINNHPSDSLEISLEQNAEEPPDLDRRVFIYFHDIHTSIDAETMKASFEKCGEVKECTTFLEKVESSSLDTSYSRANEINSTGDMLMS